MTAKTGTFSYTDRGTRTTVKLTMRDGSTRVFKSGLIFFDSVKHVKYQGNFAILSSYLSEVGDLAGDIELERAEKIIPLDLIAEISQTREQA